MVSLEELFCSVDDFCKTFEPQWKQQLLGSGLKSRNRSRSLTLSEIMPLLIGFHQSCYRNFKTYYQEKVQGEWACAFPGAVSYAHFIEWVPGTLVWSIEAHRNVAVFPVIATKGTSSRVAKTSDRSRTNRSFDR